MEVDPVESSSSAALQNEAPQDASAVEEALQQLMDIIAQLETERTNIRLLKKHLAVARKCDMDEQVGRGLEMLVAATGCDQGTWLETLGHIKREVAQAQQDRLPAIVQLLSLATQDYLSISIAQELASIILILHPAPAAPTIADNQEDDGMTGAHIGQPLIEEDEARTLWRSVVGMAENDIAESQSVWRKYIAWEEGLASSKEGDEKQEALKRMHGRFMGRLQTPHANLQETSQLYSTFNTTYFPEEYEANMIKANKVIAKTTTKLDFRDPWITGYNDLYKQVEQSTPEEARYHKLAYLNAWLDMETKLPTTEMLKQKSKGKQHQREDDQIKLDPKWVTIVYEQMLAILSGMKSREGRTTEAGVWLGYARFMASTNGISRTDATRPLERAVRCCPDSGELWASLLRNQEHNKLESDVITSTYMRALSTGELTPPPDAAKGKGKTKAQAQASSDDIAAVDVSELVTLEVAWCGYMRRLLGGLDDDMGDDDDEKEDAVEATIRESLARVKDAFPKGDPSFRLERFLISWLERKGKVEQATSTWESVIKAHAKSSQAVIAYAEFLTRNNEYNKARTVCKIAVGKPALDWPEGVWSAWLLFEDYYGTVESVIAAKTRVASLTEAATKKQMAQQATAAAQPVPVATTQEASAATVEPVSEAVAATSAEPAPERKRKSEDQAEETQGPIAKKARIVEPESEAAPHRDREFVTVLVSNLAAGTSKEDVQERFKDCGEIRIVTLTEKGDSATASVEFMERESVPAALTKDKKKIGENQVNVYQAGQTTLFVTNFPETANDAAIKALFSTYGEILSTRWPSKKYKESRRFCYVQFTTTGAAHAATELNGTIYGGLPISVLISDPDRKKQRSDADTENNELYVSGLSKFVEEADLRKLFGPFGDLKRVTVMTDPEGHCRGFAFIEYVDKDAMRSALNLNGSELKQRKMSVKLADVKRKGAPKPITSREERLKSNDDRAMRTIRVKGLPEEAQEGLLQQIFEAVTKVKKVIIYARTAEAIVELLSPEDAQAVLKSTEPIAYEGTTLNLSLDAYTTRYQPKAAAQAAQVAAASPGTTDVAMTDVTEPAPEAPINGTTSAPTAPPATTASFKPRPPKAGAKKRLGMVAAPHMTHAAASSSAATVPATNGAEKKGQDDFRKMLLEGKK